MSEVVKHSEGVTESERRRLLDCSQTIVGDVQELVFTTLCVLNLFSEVRERRVFWQFGAKGKPLHMLSSPITKG